MTIQPAIYACCPHGRNSSTSARRRAQARKGKRQVTPVTSRFVTFGVTIPTSPSRRSHETTSLRTFVDDERQRLPDGAGLSRAGSRQSPQGGSGDYLRG